MSNFVVASQSFEEQALNVASDLPEVDLTRSFASGLSSEIAPGTILKRTGGETSEYEPWIQGTDAPSDIVGIYVGIQDLDTDERGAALVRRFGPVRESELVAWTSADGSSTADPSGEALTALSEELVLPM